MALCSKSIQSETNSVVSVCIFFSRFEGIKYSSPKSAQTSSNQLKSQVLFHRNIPPQDFIRKTLNEPHCSTKEERKNNSGQVL